MVARFFNTAGPVKCDKHYCLPPLERFNLTDILTLIDQEKYFVLHAPRQTGKTSALFALMYHLNQQGQYRCVYFNVEAGQAARNQVADAMQAILGDLAINAEAFIGDDFPMQHWSAALSQFGGYGALGRLLGQWAEASPQPLVLLMDEIDALIGDSLISVLRQLRAGYPKRPAQFPHSVVLCGVRDVRDYRLHSAQSNEIITGGSAFNVKAKSLRLGNFDQDDVARLYQQHTDETGQVFEPDALALAWELTQGQPWLVNALAHEVCFEIEAGRDRTQPVTVELLSIAKENIIERRETHLDQLADKLREPRVQRVITPILAGDATPDLIPTDDIGYVADLGLITTQGQLRIANQIYREVIPRELTHSTQLTITQEAAWYIGADGRLKMDSLIEAFQQFFREHSESWVERFDYKEAGPQLLMQAFLQRIINSGGRIEREYGLGRGRTDLLVIWPYPDGVQRVVIELKLLHKSLEKTIETGLKQTWVYFDRVGAEAAHLIIFDRSNNSWDEKIFRREEMYQGQATPALRTRITVWGM